MTVKDIKGAVLVKGVVVSGYCCQCGKSPIHSEVDKDIQYQKFVVVFHCETHCYTLNFKYHVLEELDGTIASVHYIFGDGQYASNPILVKK